MDSPSRFASRIWLAWLLTTLTVVGLTSALWMAYWLDAIRWMVWPLLLTAASVLAVGGLLRGLGIPASSAANLPIVDVSRSRGPRVVVIGGGTGLPSVLRGLKTHTHDLTAIVTVADDGGSSGRLRRDMGVLPPGDLRNNIVALADDESLMAKLFQFRFTEGDLKGHAFGNLFISALASVTDGGLETALVETGRVLIIQGRVLPSTLQDVNLQARVVLPNAPDGKMIFGEAAIGDAGGIIKHLELIPGDAVAYPGSVDAILNAELVVIGPGSLYTSILPNLLVAGVANALRATTAYIVYVCNVATQPGETDNYTVAEHIMALETFTGRGVFQAALANNTYHFEGDHNVDFVMPVPPNHQVLQRYEILYTDLTDSARPWRHDPEKLARALMSLYGMERYGKPLDTSLFADSAKTG